MELIDNFGGSAHWVKADGSKASGFEDYRVAGGLPVPNAKGQHKFTVVPHEGDGNPKVVYISDVGDKNPLGRLANISLKLGGKDGDVIMGVMLDDDCVVRKK